MREPVHPQRLRLRPTAAGRILLPVAAAAAGGGWLLGGTTGLFAAALFALLLLAALLAYAHTRGLVLALPRSRASTVGTPFRVELDVANRSRLLAVRDVVLHQGERSGVDAPPSGSFTHLGPRERRAVPLALRLTERGREHEVQLVARSSFPLGLFRCEATYAVPADLLGLPRVGVLLRRDLLDDERGERNPGRRPARLGEEELHGVRDWREGESLRRVHWRLSARRDRLIAREFRRSAVPAVRVLLTTTILEQGPWLRRDPSFERAVALAATLVAHFLRRGRTLRLGLTGERTQWSSHRGRGGLARALVRLAEVQQRPGDPWTALAGALAERDVLGGAGTTLAVLAGRGLEAHTRPGARVLDVDDSGIDAVFRRDAHALRFGVAHVARTDPVEAAAR
jgi:uncharacterized protein (DUF58 family)